MESIDIKQYQGLYSLKTMARLLLELGKINDNVVVLGADIFTLGELFKEKYPNRYFNFGIAEANMILAAAGFSAFGKIPIVEVMGFLIPRVAEQIRDDVCYNNHNVKIIANSCGVNLAIGGVSHHVDVDISILRSFPNMTIIQPASPKEILFAAYKVILDFKGPAYLRLSRGIKEEIYESDHLDFEIGKAVTLKEGNDITIIASGLPVQLALKAEKVLMKEGINTRIINMHTIKPIDTEIVLKAARETKGVITIEDGSVAGGLGAAVSSIVSNSYPTIVKQLGFPMDRFTMIGPSEEVLWDYFGINIDNVVKEVKNIILLKERDR
jgi:transketolase